MISKVAVAMCVALLACTCTVARAAPWVGQHRSDPWDEYMNLVNRVFPAPHFDRDTRFILVLRYLPSFHPEIQIALTDGMDSHAEVEQRALTTRLQRVQLDAGFETVSHDPDLLLRMTGLHRRAVSVSSDLAKQWLQGLFTSLQTAATLLQQRTLERTTILDGTTYTIDLETGADHLSFSFTGSEIDTSGPHDDIPIVLWMNSIREQVAKLPEH